jgi:hypothetical protein
MGDVFKLPFFIETFLQQFNYATVEENHGQTILWRQVRSAHSIPNRLVEHVARLDYRATILARNSFRIVDLDSIVALVRKAMAGRLQCTRQDQGKSPVDL